MSAVQEQIDGNASLPDPGSPEYATLPRIRLATGIERVRRRTEQYAETEGRTPTAFLAPIGPAAARSARANFARNVLGVAGFEVAEPLKFDAPADAAAAAAEDPPDIVVLCSADPEYPTLTPTLRSALTDQNLSPLLIVAGNPNRIDGEVTADDFIYSGRPLRDSLTALQDRLGIPPLDADDT